MARLKDLCTINPKSPGFQDELIVSFVPMPKVGENGEIDPSEERTYQDVKKDLHTFRMVMYYLPKLHLVWKTLKVPLPNR